MKNRILVLAVLLLVGCATSAMSLNKINKIKAGMTREQVIEAIGKPENIHAGKDAEFLIYTMKERVTGRKEAGLVVENVKYFVRIVGGRVESFGRLSVR